MKIDEVQEKITPILRSHDIARASVFGSVARGNDRPDSDVDVLVKFRKPVGLVGFVGLANEMEKALGRKVDLVAEGGINKFIEPYIRQDLKTIYEG